MRLIIALFLLLFNVHALGNTVIKGSIPAQQYGIQNSFLERTKHFPASSYVFLAPLSIVKNNTNNKVQYLMANFNLKLITNNKETGQFVYKLIPENKIYVTDENNDTRIVDGKINVNGNLLIKGTINNNDQISLDEVNNYSITPLVSSYQNSFIFNLKKDIPVTVELSTN